LPRNTEPVPIRLVEVRDYRGRLVDTSGQPIAKARIRPIWLAQKTQGQLLFAYDSVDLPPEFAKEMAGESGADGVFVLRGAPTEGAVRAEVSAPGFGSFHATCALSAPTTIRLAPTGSVRGSVVCKADPKAAAGIKLRLSSDQWKQPSPWDEFHLDPYAETSTQKDGSFLFAEVPPGRYLLSETWVANAPYYLDFGDRGSYPGPYQVTSRGVTSMSPITLRPTVLIHGTVVDAKSGVGIPDVELDLSYPAGLTRTDARGAYSGRVAPGTLRIYVKDVPDAYVQPQSDARRLETEATKEATVPAIRLQPTRAVEGIVVDESGKPVADAEIIPYAGAGFRDQQPRSDQNGRFIVKGIPDGASVQLRSRTATASTDGPVTVSPGSAPTRLVVSEKNVFRLRGSVVDETGQPIRGAAVELGAAGLCNGWHGSCTIDVTESDAQGRYQFVALSRGDTYHVQVVEEEGYGRPPELSSEASQIRGKPGQTYEVPRIVLTSLHGTVEGTVVDSAGKPLAGVRVFNNGDAREMILVRTDAAGHFRLQGLEPGPVYVFATQPEYRFTGLRTTSGATGLVVKLLCRDELVPAWTRPKPGPARTLYALPEIALCERFPS
jgi:protocatechuate 3,4-dioxygenase beta subunit